MLHLSPRFSAASVLAWLAAGGRCSLMVWALYSVCASPTDARGARPRSPKVLPSRTVKSVDQAVAPETPPTDVVMPLKLEEAIGLALQNNLAIERARAAQDVAHAQVEQARAVFDPAIGLTTAVTQTKTLPVTRASSSDDTETNTSIGASIVRPLSDRVEVTPSLQQKLITGANYTIGLLNTREKVTPAGNRLANPRYTSEILLTFTQPLLKDFGLTVNTALIQQGQHTEEIVRQQVIQTILDTVFAVQQGYWILAFRIQDLSAKRASQRLAEDFLAESKQRVALGTMAGVDLIQAETQVKTREGDVIAAETAVLDAEDSLKLVLNLPERRGTWQFRLEPSEALQFIPVPDMALADRITLAFQHRPDVIQAQNAIAAQAIARDAARHQRLPRLDVQGQVSVNALSRQAEAALANLGKAEGYQWALGLQFAYPLGNRAALSEVQKQEALLRQSYLDQRQVLQTVEQQLRQTVRNLESAGKRVEVTRAATLLARTQLESEQEKFRLGLSTSFNVLTFQSQLTTARSTEASALSEYNIALARLDQVMGVLSTGGPQPTGVHP